MSVSVEVVNADITPEVEKKFDGVPYWVALFLMTRIQGGFESSTDPWGAPWAPLAKSTLESRKKRNIAGVKPLLATHAMFDSLVVLRGSDFAELHMNAPAGYHQSGTRRMPARKIVPLEGEEVVFPDSWSRDMADFVSEKMGTVE